MSAVPSTENDDAAVETPTETTPRTADDAELRAAIRRLPDLIPASPITRPWTEYRAKAMCNNPPSLGGTEDYDWATVCSSN